MPITKAKKVSVVSKVAFNMTSIFLVKMCFHLSMEWAIKISSCLIHFFYFLLHTTYIFQISAIFLIAVRAKCIVSGGAHIIIQIESALSPIDKDHEFSSIAE